MQNSENNAGNSNKSSFSMQENKKKQLDIIQKTNPMLDDYHTGIRSIEDIKTLQETLEDSDWSDYDEFNPDLTRQDIENAIETGKLIYRVHTKNGRWLGEIIDREKDSSGDNYAGIIGKEIDVIQVEIV